MPRKQRPISVPGLRILDHLDRFAKHRIVPRPDSQLDEVIHSDFRLGDIRSQREGGYGPFGQVTLHGYHVKKGSGNFWYRYLCDPSRFGGFSDLIADLKLDAVHVPTETEAQGARYQKRMLKLGRHSFEVTIQGHEPTHEHALFSQDVHPASLHLNFLPARFSRLSPDKKNLEYIAHLDVRSGMVIKKRPGSLILSPQVDLGIHYCSWIHTSAEVKAILRYLYSKRFVHDYPVETQRIGHPLP